MDDDAPPAYHQPPPTTSASVPGRLVIRSSFGMADRAGRTPPHYAPRGSSVGPPPTSSMVSVGSPEAKAVQAVPPFAPALLSTPTYAPRPPSTPPAILNSMLVQYQKAAGAGACGKKGPMSVSHPDLVQPPAPSPEPSLMSASLHTTSVEQRRQTLAAAEEKWRESQQRASQSSVSWREARESGELEARVGRRMLGLLADENKSLRSQVATASAKAAKLAHVELQYESVAAEYAELVRRQERREELELEMRGRLDAQVRGLADNNRRLQHELDLALLRLQSMEALDAADETQLASFQAALEELKSDKATLAAIKERQELELDAQRATLAEQRTHIHILDKALAAAQEEAKRAAQAFKRVHALEAELRKREELHKAREAQLQIHIAGLTLHKPKGTPRKGGSGDAELASRLQAELELKDSQIRALRDDQSSLQHKYAHLFRRMEKDRSSPQSKESLVRQLEASSAWGDSGASASARLRRLESELSEKDAIIHALVAASSSTPDFRQPFKSLETTRQRLESARRRILESPSSSLSRYGGGRLFSSPGHRADFSSVSLDRHEAQRVFREPGRRVGSGDDSADGGRGLSCSARLPLPGLHPRTASVDVPLRASSPSQSSSDERRREARAPSTSFAGRATVPPLMGDGKSGRSEMELSDQQHKLPSNPVIKEPCEEETMWDV